MGRAKGPFRYQWGVRGQGSGDAVDLGGFQGFLPGHSGQNGGQRTRQQSLAAAGWTVEKQVMKSGGGDLQCPLGMLLPANVGQIRAVHRRRWLRNESVAFNRRYQGGPL